MQLREYQIEDINKLLQHTVGGCFNEQRTGKTPTALMLFKQRDLTKFIVVCPNSPIIQWASEIEKWTGLPTFPVIGTPAKKQETIDNWNTGVLIISYDTLKRTSVRTGYIQNILKKNPQGIIIDEAHRIKNYKTACAKAIFALSDIPYRLALTGTPIDKSEHLFSLLHFFFPKSFNSYWKYIEEYCESKTGYATGGRTFKQIVGFKKAKERELQNLLNTYCTQRKRKEVMKWLPEKDYQKIKIEPNKEQKKYLKELEEYYETGHIVTQTILDRLIRVRQICTAPQLLDLKGKSPKLEWIKDFLHDYPEKSTIIFTSFTSFIHILAEELKEYNPGIIIGDTSTKLRNQYKEEFQTGKRSLLLINIVAGCEGLTLDKAEATIFIDKYPPASRIAQAEDRFVATTIDKKDKPHTIYELILKDTYDEQLYQLIEKQAAEADVINNFKKYLERSM